MSPQVVHLSSDHFSVDGTLLEAWASHKSFKPKDQPPTLPAEGRNSEVQWHGEKRSNQTHASTTDPEARLARKSNATAAKLCYAGHLLLEHCDALIVDAELTAATGYTPSRVTRNPVAAPSSTIQRSNHSFGFTDFTLSSTRRALGGAAVVTAWSQTRDHRGGSPITTARPSTSESAVYPD
jgi:hypothetical protein